MFPYIHGFDHLVGHTDRHLDLHRLLDEKRVVRRGAANALNLREPADPFVAFNPLGHPATDSGPRATLYDLARDPRFAHKVAWRKPRGLRARLGRGLMWLGWQLARPRLS